MITVKEIIRELERQFAGAGAPPAVAVLDTCVYLDIYSAHHLFGEFASALGRGETATAAVDDRRIVFRRARARESLLLALYLNSIGGATYSMGFETLSKLIELVPRVPETERHVMALEYAQMAIWFMKPLLLSNWRLLGVSADPGWQRHLSQPPGDSRKWLEPTGDAADAFLVSCAKRMGLPVISFEGVGPNRCWVSDIAKCAKREGVQALFPKDFYAGMDEDAEIASFLRRFDEHAPAYLDQNPSSCTSADMKQAFGERAAQAQKKAPAPITERWRARLRSA